MTQEITFSYIYEHSLASINLVTVYFISDVAFERVFVLCNHELTRGDLEQERTNSNSPKRVVYITNNRKAGVSSENVKQKASLIF